jgi:hypothetical protein
MASRLCQEYLGPSSTRAILVPRPALTAKFAGRIVKLTAKSRATYTAFLTLWKDADPNIPILNQATTEYAHL